MLQKENDMNAFSNFCQKIYRNQFMRFAFVGGINTLVFYSLFLLFHQVFSLFYLVAHILAFILSMIVSYFF